MDFDIVLLCNKAGVEHTTLPEKRSDARAPKTSRAGEREPWDAARPPTPPIEERTPTEADLREIVEAGGDFLGLQERPEGRCSLVQFNDAAQRTKTTMSIDPEVEQVTPENVRRLIEERRRTVPAKRKRTHKPDIPLLPA